MRQQREGSQAVAEAVSLCRPQVVAAYPITPQTHIIEHLAQKVADGELSAEFVSAESEFAAASIVLGAVATGSRAFTASASQGLLLMTEVLFNIAGLRLPVVMVCANRAVGSPINIFSDHQDSMALRDAGWIQLYVESNQEAVDTVIHAYRIAETCELPVMICMDGFFLTHTFEPVDIPEQDEVDAFVPDFKFSRTLDIAQPMTLGGGSEPDNYMEYREQHHQALVTSTAEIEKVNTAFSRAFGRDHGGLIESYQLDDAEVVLVALGSVMGAVKDAIDNLRQQGQRVGGLRLRCFRPFPTTALLTALGKVSRIIVLEKAFSAGAGGIVSGELRAALHQAGKTVVVESFIGGLGGRDLTVSVVEEIFQAPSSGLSVHGHFVGVHSDNDKQSDDKE